MSKEEEVPTSRETKYNLICVLITVLLIVAAYSNTLRAPFIFDDQVNIADNMSIRSMWPPWEPLYVSPDTGITGRPLINFTFALNYAVSGDDVWSYHALNIIIQILAALILWGFIRRTLERQQLDINKTWQPAWVALGCTLVWALHPLQTQAVTYLSQRCESLMGLFFLLVFYCAVRGWQSDRHQRAWHLLAILSFVAGAGCKEVIAASPVLLFLYEWVFTRRSWKDILKTSPLLYSGLALGLACELLLVAAGGTTSTGTGNHAFTLTEYWLTQTPVILHYIRLVFWPSDLALDYGMDFHGMIETWPALFIVAALIVSSLWLLYRRRPAGFLSAWFFAILAPTSLFPLPDVVFEHRMYLPSMAVIVLSICCLYRMGILICRRFAFLDPQDTLIRTGRYVMVLLILTVAISTYARNLYYQSALSIWADNVAKRPHSAGAQVNFGKALSDANRPLDALPHLRQGIHLIETQQAKARPETLLTAYNNTGAVYLQLGQWKAAEYFLRRSLQIQTKSIYARASAHSNLGITLFMLKKSDEAGEHFRQAILLRPNFANGHANYGAFLRAQGNTKEATDHFQVALQLKPDHIEANDAMGTIMYQRSQYREARAYFEKSLASKADNAYARNMLIEIDKRDGVTGSPSKKPSSYPRRMK